MYVHILQASLAAAAAAAAAAVPEACRAPVLARSQQELVTSCGTKGALVEHAVSHGLGPGVKTKRLGELAKEVAGHYVAVHGVHVTDDLPEDFNEWSLLVPPPPPLPPQPPHQLQRSHDGQQIEHLQPILQPPPGFASEPKVNSY